MFSIFKRGRKQALVDAMLDKELERKQEERNAEALFAEYVKGHIPDGFFDEEENNYYTGTGQIVRGIHPLDPDCIESCVIHNQSKHNLRGLPTYWRTMGPGDIRRGAFMERICPKHGCGHPDPDQIKYWERTLSKEEAAAETIHGCCGACQDGGCEAFQKKSGYE
jgi:hypothetical protein